MDPIDEVFELLELKGTAAYFGEPVSIAEHMLQTCELALLSRADDTLVAAALLHDIGHLLGEVQGNPADVGVDGQHEIIAEAWLRQHFLPEVATIVRAHVDAKRFLCRIDPDYRVQLSPASVKSLALQGGAMSTEEADRFRAQTGFSDVLALRRWDDLAKDPVRKTPPLSTFRPYLARVRLG